MSEDLSALPDFDNEPMRRAFLIKHAEYFTTIRREKRRYVRKEHPTLDEARAYAQAEVEKDKSFRFLIYAVIGRSDSYVETVGL